MPESWKVNANEPLDPYLIPTEFIPSEGKGVKWKDVFYPEPESIFLDWSDEELLVYEYQVVLSVKAFLESSVDHIQGKLTYQVCTDKICYPQETVEIKSSINQDKLLKEEPVAVEEEPAAEEPVAVEEEPVAVEEEPAAEEPVAVEGLMGSVEDSEKALTSPVDNTNQNSLGFWVLLLAGLGLAFSPCVFPIMPIVVLSVADGERGLKAFFNSLPFVFGLVLTYSVCGAAFALLGKGSGAALQSSFFGWFLSVLFIVMGIFMLSGYTIPTSSKISKFTDFLRTKGKIGLGAALGIAATPCTAPVLASASATVLQTGSLLEGFKLFGTLGLGMAIPFICFSTLGAQIPKGGKWLITIKKVMGLALVAYGLFLAWSRFDSGDGSVQSGTEEKNQIYYFTAKWCIPCRAVDKNVWQDEEVIAFFEDSNWEFIKVDLTEESEEEFQFRNEHNISGPPSLILMFSQDGLDDIVVHIGEFTKEEFFELVNSSNGGL